MASQSNPSGSILVSLHQTLPAKSTSQAKMGDWQNKLEFRSGCDVSWPSTSPSIMAYWTDHWNLPWKGWKGSQCKNNNSRQRIHTPCFPTNPSSWNQRWNQINIFVAQIWGRLLQTAKLIPLHATRRPVLQESYLWECLTASFTSSSQPNKEGHGCPSHSFMTKHTRSQVLYCVCAQRCLPMRLLIFDQSKSSCDANYVCLRLDIIYGHLI